jgi:hypothetical protein
MKTKKRGEIGLDEALGLRTVIRGEAGDDEQFMRRLRLRSVNKLCTVIHVHKCVDGKYLGYVHIDNTPRDKAAAASWE